MDEKNAREEARTRAAIDAAQAPWQTPPAVVEAAVRRAAGTSVVALTRLYAGYSNEVYDVAGGAGQRLIVRIAHRAGHFLAERWAIDRCRAAGLPAPVVLGVEHLALAGEPLSICVQARLPGTPLLDLARARGRDDPQVVGLCRQAGGLLAALHRLPVAGYGRLDPAGRGPYSTWDAFFVDALAERASRLHGPSAATLHDLLRVAIDLLSANRTLLRSQPARLLHGDVGPMHLLVDVPGVPGVPGDPGGESATDGASRADGPQPRIVGILDLEDCLAGDPAFDFARWHPDLDARVPLAPVIAGYVEAAVDPGEDFLLRLRLGQLRYSVHWAMLMAERDDLPAVAASAGFVRREIARSAAGIDGV